VAWLTEGILLICWLALQDDVREVDYGTLQFRKGRLEEELATFLLKMERQRA
jgi:hypothetical protein